MGIHPGGRGGIDAVLPAVAGMSATLTLNTFNPANLPSALLFLDARKGIHQTGGVVTQWDDQTSNGYNVSGGTGPAYTASGGPNNNPYLTSSQLTQLLNVSVPALVQPCEYFFVGQATGSAPGWYAVAMTAGATLNDSLFQVQGAAQVEQYNPGGGFGGAVTLPTGTDVVVDAIYHGLTSSLQVDGGTTTGTAIATTTSGGGFSIGNAYGTPTQGWVGYIYSVLVCNAILSSGDRTSVMNYFQAAWGV